VNATHLIGLMVVIGPLSFGIGAANPYLARAWTAPRERFLAIVAGHPRSWRVTNLLFVAGTTITAAGLATLPGVVPDGSARALALAGAVGFAIAAVLWNVSLVHRLAVTPATAREFVDRGTIDPSMDALDRLSGGLFKAFIVIGSAGLAAIGVALANGGPIPAPIGWGAAVFSGVLVVGLVVTGDMPPFTVYIAPLVFGLALLGSP